MTSDRDPCEPVLHGTVVEAVLARLGFATAPTADLDGLTQLYGTWCRTVPFDNVIKRVHLVSGATLPFPNATAAQFFDLYLRHGTGGTCWPSSAAWHALLVALGFRARRGSAAMRDDVVGPVHTHATVLVDLDGADYWVDTAMLTEYPILLARGQATHHGHPLNPTRVEPVGELWRVWWRHPFKAEDVRCLLLDDNATAGHYLARYEASRAVSPLNTALHAITNFDDRKVTAAFGQRFERRADGVRRRRSPIDTPRRSLVSSATARRSSLRFHRTTHEPDTEPGR